MSAIMRWSPLNRMLSQWPDLWDDDLGTGLSPMTGNNIDIYETTDEVVVSANVAGVDQDHIDLTFEKGVLWIKAEKVEEDNQNKKHYSKSSWNYSYKVAIPGLIDMNQEPQADVDKGVVTVRFKKSEVSKPRKLKINSK